MRRTNVLLAILALALICVFWGCETSDNLPTSASNQTPASSNSLGSENELVTDSQAEINSQTLSLTSQFPNWSSKEVGQAHNNGCDMYAHAFETPEQLLQAWPEIMPTASRNFFPGWPHPTTLTYYNMADWQIKAEFVRNNPSLALRQGIELASVKGSISEQFAEMLYPLCDYVDSLMNNASTGAGCQISRNMWLYASTVADWADNNGSQAEKNIAGILCHGSLERNIYPGYGGNNQGPYKCVLQPSHGYVQLDGILPFLMDALGMLEVPTFPVWGLMCSAMMESFLEYEGW